MLGGSGTSKHYHTIAFSKYTQIYFLSTAQAASIIHNLLIDDLHSLEPV